MKEIVLNKKETKNFLNLVKHPPEPNERVKVSFKQKYLEYLKKLEEERVEYYKIPLASEL